MAEKYRVDLFGGLRLTVQDHVVDHLDGRKSGALLGYVAYFRDRAHSRAALIDIVWPGGDPSASRASLRQALSSIRKAVEEAGGMPDDLLVTTNTHVRLAPAVSTDVHALQRTLAEAELANDDSERISLLRQAVDFYRGDLLPGFDEMWILGERQRMSEYALAALRRVTRYLESTEDWASALDYAHRAVAADAAREDSHLALMRLYAAIGQPASALRQYKEMERALKVQLGEAPSEGARQLAEEIRRQPAKTNGGNGNHSAPFQVGFPESQPDLTPISIASDVVPGNSPPFDRSAVPPHLRLLIRLAGLIVLLLAADVGLRIAALRHSNLSNVIASGSMVAAKPPKWVEPLTVQPGSPLASMEIVYDDRVDGDCDIYTMRGDGSHVRRLTWTVGDDLYGSWSPDGSRIAFMSNRDGGAGQIYVMKADGTNPRRVTRSMSGESSPSWCPTSNQIAFYGSRTGQPQIFVINADGTGERQLSKGEGRDTRPCFSPNGARIVFNRTIGKTNDIFTMDANGGDVRQLTHSDGHVGYIDGAYSPDGKSIAFLSNRDSGGKYIQVYVMNADGTNIRRVTSTAGDDDHPRWSPNGEWIIYNSSATGSNCLFAIHPDGTSWTLLSGKLNGTQRCPSFRPISSNSAH